MSARIADFVLAAALVAACAYVGCIAAGWIA